MSSVAGFKGRQWCEVFEFRSIWLECEDVYMLGRKRSARCAAMQLGDLGYASGPDGLLGVSRRRGREKGEGVFL